MANLTFVPYPTVVPTASLPLGYFYQGNHSNNVADAANDIDFSAGSYRSDDNTADIITTALTKRGEINFSAGNNGGMLDSGAIQANILYYFFSIFNPSTLAKDFLMSLSRTSPTLPGGFTKKRLIFAMRTDGAAAWLPFQHSGNRVRYKTVVTEISDNVMTDNTFKTATILAPPRSTVKGYISTSNTSLQSEEAAYMRLKGSTDAAVFTTAAIGFDSNSAVFLQITDRGECEIDDNSQVEYAVREAANTASFFFNMTGFVCDWSVI